MLERKHNLPLSEKLSQKEIVLSSQIEKRSVFLACLSQLRTDTKHEVNGVLKEEGLAYNNALRGFVKKLAIDLGRDKHINPEEWLFMGITDFIPDNKLQEWANSKEQRPWTNADFHKTAEYFLKKKREQTISQEKIK